MNFLVGNNKTVTTAMLIIGIICLLLAIFVIFLYIRKVKQEANNKEDFNIKSRQTKYKIFHFWGHIIYIFIVFTLFVAAIILVTIGIGSLAASLKI